MNSQSLHLFCRTLSLIFLSCAMALGLSAKTHLKIAAAEDLIENYKAWTASTPWDKIENFQSPHATRPVIDLLLQLHALKAGGLDFDFTLIPYPSYEQAKVAVLDGKADLSAETIWNNEIDANQIIVDRTAPVIRLGEFNKGIYVLPSNKLILNTSSIEELQKHRALVVETWHTDTQTLQRMQLQGVEKAPALRRVGPMLEKYRGDFVLMEFSSAPDMSIELGGVKLIPVPNCKVAISYSRAWIVSKNSPLNAALNSAFDKGISAIRSAGTIEKAYTESGFFNPKIKLWPQIF